MLNIGTLVSVMLYKIFFFAFYICMYIYISDAVYLQVSLPQRSMQLHQLKLSAEEQSVYNVLFARSRYECEKK